MLREVAVPAGEAHFNRDRCAMSDKEEIVEWLRALPPECNCNDCVMKREAAGEIQLLRKQLAKAQATAQAATLLRQGNSLLLDAANARLAKAERALRSIGWSPDAQGEWAARDSAIPERATDSADECLGCSSPTSCAKNGCAIKRQRATDSAPAAPRAFYVGGGKTEPADPEIIGWCSGCRDAVYRGREHQCSISSLDSEVKP